MQMVDRMDQGAIPAQVVAQSYEALWKLVSKALYRTHVEGKLKVYPSAPCDNIAEPFSVRTVHQNAIAPLCQPLCLALAE